MTNNLTFGQALEALKDGKSVAREGWNGKGMFIYLNGGSSDIPVEKEAQPFRIDGIPNRLFSAGDIGTTTRLPNINMRAVSGSIVTGWLASQTDMLAEDWCIIDY